MSQQKSIVILGSTGSVGKSTLSVIALHPDKYSVYALTANSNVSEILSQCEQFLPRYVAMADEQAAVTLQQLINESDLPTKVLAGHNALVELAQSSDVDAVMVAIVGAVGLLPSLAAVKAGKQVMIANKEPLVMAGDLFISAASESGANILPIDSEHNAIYQCLPNPFDDQVRHHVKQLVLTASGGPFLGQKWDSLQQITPKQAIAHPNWSMGPKISIDSATMMNKGLELIEATHLFGISAEKIEVLIHPESIIHSMVEYVDGSCLAQLGSPDMCIPIAHALAWPERIESGAQRLNLAEIAKLSFLQPDYEQIPCLKLARQVAIKGGNAPTVMNAANEVAVDAFIKKIIGYTEIYTVIDTVLNQIEQGSISGIDDVLGVDKIARQSALKLIESIH